MPRREKMSKAKTSKKDEFYTQFNDIQDEMNSFLEYDKDVFKDKIVLLPCDDPEWSNFTRFFAQNFERFGLKKLISTSYANEKKGATLVQLSLFESESPKFDKEKTNTHGKIFILDRDENKSGKIDIDDLKWDYLNGDGDFRSEEVKKLRDEADIIITNPPFSLFREFLKWILEANKKFAIIGSQNAISYQEVFPKIMHNNIWLGKPFKGNVGYFKSPYEDTAVASNHQKGFIRVSGVLWYTNIDHGRRHTFNSYMTMGDNLKYSKHKEIKENGYIKYDNYDAVDIPYSDAIPSDYKGIMGVPITFMDKYNPEQFEIIGIAKTPLGSSLRTKVYDKQVQHSLKNGYEVLSKVTKLNDGPAILLKDKPNKYPYYEIDGKYYISVYARILIKFKGGKNEDDIKN